MRHSLRDQTLTPRDRGHGNPRRIAGGFAVSLLLHAAVLLALVLRLEWKPDKELLPPPATVNMVFEGGRPEGPSTPEPVPKPEASTEPAAAVGGPPGGGEPPPPKPLQTLLTPPEPPPPAPQTAPVPPKPTETPKAEPVPPPPPPPSAEAPPPEPGPAEVAVPPPEPISPPSPPEPRTTPPPSPPEPAAKPETVPPVRQAEPVAPPPSFPKPLDYSIGKPAPEPGAAAPGKPLLSLGLPKKGLEDSTPFSIDTDAEVGPDWRNALSAWVTEHSYYPSQAAELGQQGTVRVLVTMMPDGRVVSVDMERRSGSPWLDLALEGMFRGAKLPPMPKSVGDQPVPFHFTMHYIIIR